MKDRRTIEKRTYRASGDNEAKKRFVVIGICLIAVLLAAAILLTVRRNRADEALGESVPQAAAAAAETGSPGAQEDDSSIALKACDIPEIELLVEDYFTARLEADSTRIFEIFGRTDTSSNEDFEAKLTAQAAWIQEYRDIEVYITDGVADDDYFCIVTYNIDFRRTDTLAPGIMYFFAVRGEDGSYTFAENLLKDRVDYAEQVLSADYARSLIQDTDTRLKEALDSNSTLALIYVSFQNDEIYKEAELVVDAEQDVDFMDPSASILVGEDVLAEIAEEAAEAASREAREGASDVYSSYGGDDSADKDDGGPEDEGLSEVEWIE